MKPWPCMLKAIILKMSATTTQTAVAVSSKFQVSYIMYLPNHTEGSTPIKDTARNVHIPNGFFERAEDASTSAKPCEEYSGFLNLVQVRDIFIRLRID